MSTNQRLTLIGLYNYDSTLFDNLLLPDGYDNTTFINSLLLEHGEKCVLYSNPTFLKNAIGVWSSKWALELERIYDALSAEYDPIYNYDRYESYTDTDDVDRTVKNTPDYTNLQTNNYTEKQTNDYDIVTEQNTSGTNTHEISAYNSSSYEPSEKNTINNGKSTTSNDGTITNANTGTITNKLSGTTEDTADNMDRTFKHESHVYGNIGVTTSAQMVTEVVKQRMTYNLYDAATRLFANELLIGIY